MSNVPGVPLCVVTHISSYCRSADICQLIIGFWLHPRIVAIQPSFGGNQKDGVQHEGLQWDCCLRERRETNERKFLVDDL